MARTNAEWVSFTGAPALKITLRELPERIAARVLSGAVAEGAKIVRDEARRLAPVLQVPDKRRIRGLLQKSIRSTRGKRRAWEASAFVTVRRLSAKKIREFKTRTGKDSRNNPNDPFYWVFLEFGRSDGMHKPFIRPAYDTKKREAAEVIAKQLRAGIQHEASKLYDETKGRK